MRTPEPTAWAVSHWWDEPWSRGAWSLLRVGGSPETRRRLGEPIAGRVILVGEATHPTQAGMTHGAYEEGMRASQWCVDSGHRRVAVIGAGAAGLGAARALSDAGVEVEVFEARDRIGGRIRSVDLGGVVSELGANWLQQGERNSLRPLAESLGLRTIDTNFHNPLDLGPEGPIATAADVDIVAEFRTRIETLNQDADRNDVSAQALVDSWLMVEDRWPADTIRRIVDSELYLDAGAPLSDLSARYGFEPGVGEGDSWIVGGYAQLLDALANGLTIHVGAPVEHVNYEVLSGVVLRLADREPLPRFDAVVVTVPAAVLRAGGVSFDPPLPIQHRESLNLLTAGRVEKVALRFEQRWWTQSESNYLRVSDGRAGCASEWLDLTETIGVPMITGLFVGEWVGEIWGSSEEQKDDRGIARAATQVLFQLGRRA